jgi:exodeoxyribonuclease VII small subunit
MSDRPLRAQSGVDAEGQPAAELGYAEASAELEAIIAELDQGLVDVDHLEVRFRRAIEIVEELDRRIHRARDQVDALLPRLGAIGGADGAGAAQGSTAPSAEP